ncbi:MAG: hypothetical protein JST02_13870 [Bacteroidetes bacterium]|nr:hypothetical protein [Bacteroidota bacterium]
MKKPFSILFSLLISIAALSQRVQFIGLPNNTVEVRNNLRIAGLHNNAEHDSTLIVDEYGNVKQVNNVTNLLLPLQVKDSLGEKWQFIDSSYYTLHKAITNGSLLPKNDTINLQGNELLIKNGNAGGSMRIEYETVAGSAFSVGKRTFSPTFAVGDNTGVMAGSWTLTNGGNLTVSTSATGRQNMVILNNSTGNQDFALSYDDDGTFYLFDKTRSRNRIKIDTAGVVYVETALSVGPLNLVTPNNAAIGTGNSVSSASGASLAVGESGIIDENSEAALIGYGWGNEIHNSNDAKASGTQSVVLNSSGGIAEGVGAHVYDSPAGTAFGGEGPEVTGLHGLALQGGKANGNYSVAMQKATANGLNSFASGDGNIADGEGTAVLGGTNKTGSRDNTVYIPSLNIWGDKIFIETGSNKPVGTATLSAGSVTVSNTTVTANSLIFINGKTCTNCGAYRYGSIIPGTSFVISSTNGTDASTVTYLIVN